MLRPIFDYCSTSLGNRRALWSRDEGRCSVPDSAGPGLTSGALIDSDVAADRTWARVDLGAVVGNYESIRRAIGPGPAILAVVKADAYGHGGVAVARALSENGCRRFAVACLAEAAELREAGIEGEVAVFGGFLKGQEGDAAELGLTPFVQDKEQIERWNQQARRVGRRLPYHLEIDTGMSRCGFDDADPGRLAAFVRSADQLALEGLATHHASAEDFTSGQCEQQHRRFRNVVDSFTERGLRPKYLHCANSVALAYRAELDFDLVRPGISLYGYVAPALGDAPASRLQLTPALEWKTRIQVARPVAAGGLVGYNGTFRVEDATRIGVLPVGYGDGFDRRLSNRGEVVIAGRRCPIVGSVSMDITLVDLYNVPDSGPGDEVTLIGESMDAAEMARRLDTIPLEVLCRISKRVPRIHTKYRRWGSGTGGAAADFVDGEACLLRDAGGHVVAGAQEAADVFDVFLGPN